MANQSPILLVGLTALALLTEVPRSQSQAAPTPNRDPVAVAMQADPHVAPFGNEVIAAGDRYEANLADGRVLFRPILGGSAPHSLPWQFHLESVTRDGEHVVDIGKDSPPIEILGRTAVFARSATFRERYEARAEGLEQSFEFRERVAGTGDLIVRGRITTSTAAEACADGSLRFGEPGIGGVQVGAVTGIDALGNTVPGTLRLVGDLLEMSLPAAFVDTAALPLVLDPLLGTWFDPTFGSPWSEGKPDVAYDASNDVYLVVWERTFAANDIAVRGQMVDGTGNPVGTTLHLSTGPAPRVEVRPRVCSVNAVDRFLVTWLAPGPSSTQVIEASLVDASTGTKTWPVVLVAPTFLGQPRSAESPCLAGDLSAGNQAALLVYHVPAGSGAVYAARVEVPPTGNPVIQAGNTHAAFTGVFLAPYGLSVSKTGGSAGRHVVTLSYNDLRAVAVDRNALPIGAAVVIDTHTNGRNYNPATDGNGADFLCVWEKERGAGAADRDVWCIPLVASGSGLSASGSARRISNTTTTAGFSYIVPDVAFLGGKYAVCYQHSAYQGLVNVVVFGILVEDCVVCGPIHSLRGTSGTFNDNNSPRCIGKRSGALGASDEGIMVWAEDALSPVANKKIYAQRFVSRSQGLSPTVVAPGCGTAGTAGTTGSGFVFGNTSFAFTLGGADPNALLFFGLAWPGTPTSCGPCQILSGAQFEFVVNSGGSATRPFPVPCDGVFLDLLLQSQWVAFNTGSSPCALAPTLSASAILQVQLVP